MIQVSFELDRRENLTEVNLIEESVWLKLNSKIRIDQKFCRQFYRQHRPRQSEVLHLLLYSSMSTTLLFRENGILGHNRA